MLDAGVAVRKYLPQMEKTDSSAKQAALDNKAAHAGDGSVTREEGMGIDEMGEQAGLDVQPEQPLSTKEDLERRDKNRFDPPK